MNSQFDQKYFLIALILSILLHALFLINTKFDLFKNNFLDTELVIEMFILPPNEKDEVLKYPALDLVEEIKKEEDIASPLPLRDFVSEKVDEIITPKSEIQEPLKQENIKEVPIVPGERIVDRLTQPDDKQIFDEESFDEDINSVAKKERIEIDTSKLLAQISTLDLSTKKSSSGIRVKRISARSKDYEYRAYFESWRQKVERIGALNYPKEAMLGNFGSLRLTVSINSDGSVEQIVVDKSSGSKELDEAAKNIVMLSAPFAEFSSKMRNEVDVVNISRTWKFTKTNQLLTN